ncbi:Nn.00g076170.m01.CDS01 [Neocucurbitaria sp. VM-36]
MSSTTTTTATVPNSTGAGAGADTTRLLDRDPSKFRSIKQVIVVGRPGTGTDAIAEALRMLKFKVYDFKAASDRHARDFPLWVEAARLRSEGKPYDQSDYDKVIGDHNALVGAPTCFFDHDFIKLYPNVKVIMVNREPDAETVETLLQNLNKFANKQIMARIDADFFGNISAFLELACKAKLDHQAIRDTVREKNLLEIDSFNDWKPICDFLGARVPEGPVPSMQDKMIAAELALRPLQLLHKLKDIHGMKVMRALQALCAVAGIALSANMVVEDPRGAAVLGFGVCTIIAAWYFANRTDPKALEPDTLKDNKPMQKAASTSSNGKQQAPRRNTNNRNYGKQGRGHQKHHNHTRVPREARSIPPTLPGWGNVQADIYEGDKLNYQEMRAMAKGFEGHVVTFNHAHKET